MSCCSSLYPALADLIQTVITRDDDISDPDNYGSISTVVIESQINVNFQPIGSAAGRTDTFAAEREDVDAVIFTDTLLDIMATKSTVQQEQPDQIRYKNVLYYVKQVEDWRDTVQPQQKVFLKRVDNQ